MAYHVLIAEDEEVTREAVRAGLSRLLPAAQIHAVKNGVEAVACAAQRQIGLAFLDIKMPEMNGIVAAQKIHRMQADCQIVFLTAYNDFEYVRSALRLDAVDYLLKPFDQGTLADAVHKALKRAAAAGVDGTAAEDASLDRKEYELRLRWLEEPEMEALLGGRLDAELIPAGTCGSIVAMTGPDGAQMQRLRHVLTGLDLGGDIRCLAGRKERYFFIAAWSVTQEALQEQLKKQMTLLAARLERQFGTRLLCGISGVFLDDGDIPEACMDAFGQMWACTEQDAVRVSDHVMQGDILDAAADAGLSGKGLQVFYDMAGYTGEIPGRYNRQESGSTGGDDGKAGQ